MEMSVVTRAAKGVGDVEPDQDLLVLFTGVRSPGRGDVVPPLVCRHEVSIVPSQCGAAQIPNASDAQFAYHQRSFACTRYAVGTAENGFAIRISRRHSRHSRRAARALA